MFWKVALRGKTLLGDVELRKCCEADTMDEAIALVESEVLFTPYSRVAQVFSDLEARYPEAAEEIFLESGSFHANFKEPGK